MEMEGKLVNCGLHQGFRDKGPPAMMTIGYGALLS
jgi:hypothetical protein